MGVMMVTVHTISLGICNCYLVGDGDCYVLVDAGAAKKEKTFRAALGEKGIDPEWIKLIVVTHVHYDHVGSLKAIRELCQCPIAVHKSEASLLREGTVVLPRGTNVLGSTLMWLAHRLLNIHPQFFHFSPVEADIIITDEISIDAYGIPGRIIPTPGHTEGSISIVLPGGEAFVGDLGINYLPFGAGPIFPPFADDVERLFQSWEYLLSQGVTVMFPAHGSSFGAVRLGEKLRELCSRT